MYVSKRLIRWNEISAAKRNGRAIVKISSGARVWLGGGCGLGRKVFPRAANAHVHFGADVRLTLEDSLDRGHPSKGMLCRW